MTTPIQYPIWMKRAYTSRGDKFRALLAQGFTYSEAQRMSENLDVVYGPINLSRYGRNKNK